MSWAANGLNTMQGGGGIGGWVELGRTTLGGTSDTITVSSLSDKRYYMVLTDYQASGDIFALRRLNNDSGSNYSFRYSVNGGTDGTGTSETKILNAAGGYTTNGFAVSYLANRSANEKLHIGHYVNQSTAGATTAPVREQTVGKWANTSNAINRIDEVNTSTGDYASGSEVVVLGWDPADTHTNNFWEELADATQGSDAETFETGTFTAKKYLWVQAWIEGSATNNGLDPYVNSDTSTNYAFRYSNNGAADATSTSDDQFGFCGGFGTNEKYFFNAFIINNSANEKLMYSWVITDAGSTGAANAPSRRECAAKWTNTSTQITKFGFKNRNVSTGQNIVTGSRIKVWGAD